MDYVYLPHLDLTGVTEPALTFDLAYARYNDELNDRLKVYVSADCGGTWSTVYDQAGTALATAADHNDAFVPTASEWRTESLSLDAWTAESSVLIALGNVTGYGNNVWVDNVSVGPVEAPGDDDEGDDDDDDSPLGVCGNAPDEALAESEPNGWSTGGEYDSLDSAGGDLRISGTVACASQWSADVDWFAVDLPCTGEADVTLNWASGADLDYWVYGPDRGLLVKNEDEDYAGPAARSFSGGDTLYIAVSCWWGADSAYSLSIDWDATGEPATSETPEDDEPSEGAPAPGEEAASDPGDDEPDEDDEDDGPTTTAAADAAPTGPSRFVQVGCAAAGSGAPGGLALWLVLGVLGRRRRG
ncbi:MAG: hypothetical protein GY898_19245 [Proteobacteria bacterium]|nr:hypothetical protein [Pseudomonadota bacterium]